MVWVVVIASAPLAVRLHKQAARIGLGEPQLYSRMAEIFSASEASESAVIRPKLHSLELVGSRPQSVRGSKKICDEIRKLIDHNKPA
jgi:hypothetical protein